MITVEQSGRFDVDAPAAFDYITDPHNWPRYWPGLIDISAGSAWRAPGDTMRLRMRFAGRAADLTMTLRQIERPSVVRYDSVQGGFPPTAHERHFEPAADGFVYRLVVSYRPRRGLRGLFDRTIVRRGIARALRRTIENLHAVLSGPADGPAATARTGNDG
jgi:hypothetical protein